MLIDNPDTLVVVHAYAGDIHQVKQNLPYLLHHRCPVVVLSPTDAPIPDVGSRRVTCLSGGLKGWIGKQTLERQVIHLRMLLQFPHRHFLLNDADSLCLSPDLPRYLYENPDLIWSNEVTDTNPAPSLLPKLALQPPYFVSRNTIQGMLKASENPPTSYYTAPANPKDWPMPFPTECIDHYMLQLACGSGYGHFNFHTGASFETETQHGLDTMVGLVQDHGRVLIHSVKSQRSLDRVVQAHKRWRILHP